MLEASEMYQALIKWSSVKLTLHRKPFSLFAAYEYPLKNIYGNVIQTMTTKHQQIPPVAILKTCKRERFSHKPPSAILAHPAAELPTSSALRGW